MRCAKSNAIIAYCAGKNNGNFVFGLSGAQQRKARPVGFALPAGRAVARCVAGALAQPSVQGLHQGTGGVLIQGPAAHAQQALLTDVGCLGGHGFRILVADEGAAVIEPGALGSLVKVALGGPGSQQLLNLPLGVYLIASGGGTLSQAVIAAGDLTPGPAEDCLLYTSDAADEL